MHFSATGSKTTPETITKLNTDGQMGLVSHISSCHDMSKKNHKMTWEISEARPFLAARLKKEFYPAFTVSPQVACKIFPVSLQCADPSFSRWQVCVINSRLISIVYSLHRQWILFIHIQAVIRDYEQFTLPNMTDWQPYVCTAQERHRNPRKFNSGCQYSLHRKKVYTCPKAMYSESRGLHKK